MTYDALRLVEDRSSQIGLPLVEGHQGLGFLRLHHLVRLRL